MESNTVKDIPEKLGHYVIMYQIGEGSSSFVFQGMDTKTGDHVAMKFISREAFKSFLHLSNLERETRVFQRLNHKNIAKYYETIYTKDYIVIVMELLRYGSITPLLTNTDAKNHILLRWAKEILQALEYLHSRGISHRDIKPQNIGFDHLMQVKLFDFGLCDESTPGDEANISTIPCGTPFFVAPEVLTEEIYDGRKADIWSFGVSLHLMATGLMPFAGINDKEDFISKMNKISDYIKITVTGEIGEIIKLALNIDPEKRPSAQELLATHLFDNAEILRHALVRSPVSRVKAQSAFLKQNALLIRPQRSFQPTIISPIPKHTSARFIPLY